MNLYFPIYSISTLQVPDRPGPPPPQPPGENIQLCLESTYRGLQPNIITKNRAKPGDKHMRDTGPHKPLYPPWIYAAVHPPIPA